MAQTKACPKCNTMMDLRLGMYECPQCGHEEEAAQKEPERKASGPGLRREAWHQSKHGAGSSSLHPGQPPAPGTLYTPGAAPPPGLYGGDIGVRESKHPTLETEKKVYFGITVAAVGLSIIGSFLAMVTDGSVGAGGFFGNVLGSVIGLAIAYWILFGTSANMKLTCAGCYGLMLIMTVFGALAVMAKPEFTQLGYGYGVMLSVVVWGFVILQIAWIGWLISILWREAMEMKGQ